MSTATMPDKPRIGWIGLGKMGLPICERLAAQQFQLTTLIRNPEGRERADRAKLQGDSTIGGVVASAQIVVSAISDDAALLDIVFKAGGLKETLNASQIFVEISTVSPDASRRVAEAMSPDRRGLRSFTRIRLDGDGRSGRVDGCHFRSRRRDRTPE